MNMNDLDCGQSFFGEWYIDKVQDSTIGMSQYRICRDIDGTREYQLMKVIEVPMDNNVYYQLPLEENDTDSAIQYYKKFVNQIYSKLTLLEKITKCQNMIQYKEHQIFKRSDNRRYEIFIRMEQIQSFKEYANVIDLTYHDIIDLGMNICSALEVCHRNHITHGYIKPDAIFSSEDGQYKLGNFSLIPSTGIINTNISEEDKHYMAPEEAKGEPFDIRADIYSLGIVLYELLNEDKLPSGKVKMPIPAYATLELGQVILKACAKDPKDRYQTPNEFVDALKSVSIFLGDFVNEKIYGPIEEEVYDYIASTIDVTSVMKEEASKADELDQKEKEAEMIADISNKLSKQIKRFGWENIETKSEDSQKNKNTVVWMIVFSAFLFAIITIMMLLQSDSSGEEELPLETKTTNENEGKAGELLPDHSPDTTAENHLIVDQDMLSNPKTEYIFLDEVDGLDAITVLDLSDNQISDLSLLQKAKKLEFLKLSNNLISDVSEIGNVVSLNILDLSDNQIRDIHPLFSLRKLEVLSLSNNQIKEITGIEALINVSILYLNGNQIDHVECLYGLDNLVYLDISDNVLTQAQTEVLISNLPKCIINY